MNPVTGIKLAAAAVVLVGCGTALLSCYSKGRSDANAKRDLAAARAVISTERQAAGIERKTDAIVNRDGENTRTQAQEAAREIESIREIVRTRPAQRASAQPAASDADQPTEPQAPGSGDPVRAAGHDVHADRVLHLAREARAAALAAGARLQPAGTGAGQR